MQTSYTGAILIIAVLLVYALCILTKDKSDPISRFYNRAKDSWLRIQIANSLEECEPIHMDIGSNAATGMPGVSALSAMQAAETVSGQMAFADEPWLITSDNGALNYAEKDSIHKALATADYANEFDPDSTIYSGFSPLSHQAVMIGILDDSSSALHLNIGAFGAETALQDLAFNGEEGICVAGENLASQASGLISADEVFIGEQLFELPKSFEREAKADAGLMTMDYLRFGLIAAMAVSVLIGLLV